jgi:hypothetical protein
MTAHSLLIPTQHPRAQRGEVERFVEPSSSELAYYTETVDRVGVDIQVEPCSLVARFTVLLGDGTTFQFATVSLKADLSALNYGEVRMYATHRSDTDPAFFRTISEATLIACEYANLFAEFRVTANAEKTDS